MFFSFHFQCHILQTLESPQTAYFQLCCSDKRSWGNMNIYLLGLLITLCKSRSNYLWLGYLFFSNHIYIHTSDTTTLFKDQSQHTTIHGVIANADPRPAMGSFSVRKSWTSNQLFGPNITLLECQSEQSGKHHPDKQLSHFNSHL